MAIAVPTRPAASLQRDKALIVRLVEKVKAVALCRPLLLCFDRLSVYVSACSRFSVPLCIRGVRPPLVGALAGHLAAGDQAVCNFCTYHDLLRQPLYMGYWRKEVRRWVKPDACDGGRTDRPPLDGVGVVEF